MKSQRHEEGQISWYDRLFRRQNSRKLLTRQ